MTVRLAEGNRIEIVVPSTDPAAVRRVERIVERIGTIEFRVLANALRPEQKEWIDRAKALRENESEVRSNTGEILVWWVPVAKGKEEGFESQTGIVVRKVTRDRQEVMQVLVVKDPYDVNGSYLTRATLDADPNGRPSLRLDFNASGAMRFGRLTGTHLPDPKNEAGYYLGIIFDGWLHSAPMIRAAIYDRAEITGDFTKDEVQELVDILNGGSLPVMLRKVQPPAEPKQPKADS
jgi:preprotein translocase subunit SecD